MATCPFGRDVGAEPHWMNCPQVDRCPCSDELLAHAATGGDDQTAQIATWWHQHLVIDPDQPREMLPPETHPDWMATYTEAYTEGVRSRDPIVAGLLELIQLQDERIRELLAELGRDS